VELVAHWGFAAEVPENTLAAVVDAADAGANAVEVDVRAAADGTPVLHHDATLDRLTDATGRVDAHDPDAPNGLAARDDGSAGQRSFS